MLRCAGLATMTTIVIKYSDQPRRLSNSKSSLFTLFNLDSEKLRAHIRIPEGMDIKIFNSK